MTYATREDYIAEFSQQELTQRTDRDRDGIEDDGVFDRAATRADSEINLLIRSRYPVPLANVPGEIKDIALDLARFYLFSDEVPEIVQTRFETAFKKLRMIATGDTVLDVSTGPASPSGGEIIGGEILVSNQPRRFGRNYAGGF